VNTKLEGLKVNPFVNQNKHDFKQLLRSYDKIINASVRYFKIQTKQLMSANKSKTIILKANAISM